jgi:hypothetical protein
MSIKRVVASAAVSVLLAGLALGQAAPVTKPQPLRNKDPRAPKVRPVSAPEFGGVNTQYQRVSAMQFTSDVSADSYTSTWNPGAAIYDYQRFFDAAGFNHFVSSPTLPGGSRIVYVEFDFCDGSATDQHLSLTVWNCDFEGFCDSTPLTTLTSTSDAGNPCRVATESISQRVDNFLGQTLLDITMAATDGTNTFSGVILGYVLEVSPAPPTATFNDVPTGHPFFQYIEALAESGVTGGCSAAPPLYCPDNPVTRGQMAVFLSKLTGLSWSGF